MVQISTSNRSDLVSDPDPVPEWFLRIIWMNTRWTWDHEMLLSSRNLKFSWKDKMNRHLLWGTTTIDGHKSLVYDQVKYTPLSQNTKKKRLDEGEGWMIDWEGLCVRVHRQNLWLCAHTHGYISVGGRSLCVAVYCICGSVKHGVSRLGIWQETTSFFAEGAI